jgi:hypothetical protein
VCFVPCLFPFSMCPKDRPPWLSCLVVWIGRVSCVPQTGLFANFTGTTSETFNLTSATTVHRVGVCRGHIVFEPRVPSGTVGMVGTPASVAYEQYCTLSQTCKCILLEPSQHHDLGPSVHRPLCEHPEPCCLNTWQSIVSEHLQY